MATKPTAAGSFQSIYCGHVGGVTPLQQITTNLDSTGDFKLSEETPRSTWIACTNSFEQSDLRTLNLSISLMSNDDLAVKLARGLALNASNAYGAPTNQKYVILLLDADSTSDQSYLIPVCQSVSRLDLSRGKSIQSETPLTFKWACPDLDTILYYNGTYVALGTILGAQSPF